ncbi:MAG TPA: acylphosphatase [Methanothrix sp.]|jgi:acylphosphatase/peptidoglycan hydrolase CwlO-like protein|uniref:acylphosphatase n=1 Tax=Methanothrix sp. TaxID=90426 RepID=UPI002B7A5083|nr:acylphosphatase [Euryarchaeota archaeon]HON34822.1 acylphosphatase [Methanothrix sp.]
MHSVTAYVSGKVQQVGYRSRVLAAARALDITGYVTNLPDGRVKIVAEGANADLDRFLRSVRIENTLIAVTDISIEYSEPKGCYDSFYKITGEGETDTRLDTAANYLKELIVAVREGFSAVNSKLDTIISGQADLMEGQNRLVEGQNSLVEGQNRLVEGQNSLVEGQNRLVEGQNSLVEGQNRLVEGQNRLVEGQNRLVEGQNSLVEGQNRLVEGQNSLVEGQKCLAERFESGMERLAERFDASLEKTAERIEVGQEHLVVRVEESAERIVAEVRGLRSDLEGQEERLARLQGDVSEIKAKIAR